MAIQLVTTGNDKVQLVEYDGAPNCPRTQYIQQVLAPLTEHVRHLRVKSLPKDIVQGLRNHAKAAREHEL